VLTCRDCYWVMGISVADASQRGGEDASQGTGGLRDWGKARSNRAGDLAERRAREATRKANGPYAIGHVQDGERPARGGVTP